ncbi:MAG: hypothetical protein ACKN81_04050, partial [Pirellulaceae bacterium]
AAMKAGIVMNGPIPTMLAMFKEVACSNPKDRSIPWGDDGVRASSNSMILPCLVAMEANAFSDASPTKGLIATKMARLLSTGP